MTPRLRTLGRSLAFLGLAVFCAVAWWAVYVGGVILCDAVAIR